MSAHTAGPWHRNIKPVTKYPIVFAGRNTHVAQVLELGIGLSEAEANCNLIAAAPDLLDVLQAIVTDLEDGDDFSALQIARSAGRAAIAKAGGAA